MHVICVHVCNGSFLPNGTGKLFTDFKPRLPPDFLFYVHTIADHLRVLEIQFPRVQIKIHFWICPPWGKSRTHREEQIRTIQCTSELLTSIQTQPKYLVCLPMFP